MAQGAPSWFSLGVRHALGIATLVTTVTTAAAGLSGARGTTHDTAASIGVGPHLGPAALRFGRSVGSPTAGHLIGGAHLDETSYLRVEPADAEGDVRWGLEPLVAMLDRAARAVDRQFPGAVTTFGHLSRHGGGDVERHRSHESGRDADVGFFVRSALSSGAHQVFAPHFVAFRADGTAPTWPGAYFDDAKNWAFIAALVSDPEARVTHVFVAAPLRARLLAHAEQMGAPLALRIRAAQVMRQPHGALPHDDHFHVRIACPAQMAGCVENPEPPARAAGAAAGSTGRALGPRGAEHAAGRRS